MRWHTTKTYLWMPSSLFFPLLAWREEEEKLQERQTKTKQNDKTNNETTKQNKQRTNERTNERVFIRKTLILIKSRLSVSFFFNFSSSFFFRGISEGF